MYRVERRFLATPYSIYIPPIVLYWRLTGRGRSAVPVQQAKIGVLIEVAAAVHKVETGAFHIRGVLAPERGKLKTVRLFGDEAQSVGCLLT